MANASKKSKKEVKGKEEQIPVEETAENIEAIVAAIHRIDKGVQMILKAGLNHKALMLLVSSASGGMSQNQVARVIDGLESLKEKFIS